MTTVLVTGGAGYIGSHACKALAQAGYTPVTYDNLVYGHEWAVKWGPFEQGDICDRDRLQAVIRKYKPEAVMHFAAYAYVGESVENPAKYYRNNVVGSLTLLEVMRDEGINNFVFSSTCAVYGEPEVIPMTEAHVQHPINPYGTTKMIVEGMLQDFYAAHGLNSISLRYFNAAGADPDGGIGEDHDPETHLIPLVLDAAAGKRANITVFGNDYDTPDGTCIRDYIHVTDLANAHVLALQSLQEEKQCTAYNLGNGTGFSVKEVIDTAKQVTGRTIETKISARRHGDPPRLVGDATRANKELGWKPQYAGLPTILETAWRWTMRNKQLSNTEFVSTEI